MANEPAARRLAGGALGGDTSTKILDQDGNTGSSYGRVRGVVSPQTWLATKNGVPCLYGRDTRSGAARLGVARERPWALGIQYYQ